MSSIGKLNVYGGQRQEKRQGYNKVDYISKVIANANGLTTKTDENGYIITSGTPTRELYESYKLNRHNR